MEKTYLAVRKKRRQLFSTPGMQTSPSMLVSIAVLYMGHIEVHILYVTLESGRIYQTGALKLPDPPVSPRKGCMRQTMNTIQLMIYNAFIC